MPDVYPDKLVDGGMLWFVDLNAPDPLYVMPALSGLTFLAMMEMGKKQMLANMPEQGPLVLNFFRAMALVIVPISTQFPTAVLCYWTANNTFSLVQTAAFQNASVKSMCGIWDPPKPVPGARNAAQNKGMIEMIQDSIKNKREEGSKVNVKERIEMHNAAIEKNKRSRGNGNGNGNFGRKNRRKR